MACFTDTSRIFNHDITFLLIIIGLYFLLSPNIANEDRPRKISMLLFALTVAPFLGFYDGFFGPGTGSLIALAFILLCGYSLLRATANAKILNFTSNFAALLYFIIFGPNRLDNWVDYDAWSNYRIVYWSEDGAYKRDVINTTNSGYCLLCHGN